MKLIPLTILYLLVACLFGCAHVDLYTDEAKQHPTGVKFYADSQPYILVAHNKDGTITPTLIYLKDPSSARYAFYHQGWGTANMQLAMSNGILTTYGMQTDSKGPDTIQALTGLLTASAGAAKTLGAQAGAVYTEEAAKLKAATTGLRSSLANIQSKLNHLDQLDAFCNQVDAIADRMSKINYASNKTVVKQDLATLKTVATVVGTFAYPNTQVSPDTNLFNESTAAFVGQVNAVLNEIGSGNGSDSDSSQTPIDLYRVDWSPDGKTILTKVTASK